MRDAELKKRDRALLRTLKQRVRAIVRARPARLRELRQLCRFARENVRAQVKALREETKAALRERVHELRTAQRGTCQQSLARAHAGLSLQLTEAERELQQHSAHVRTTYGRKQRAPGAPSGRARARERREESDDEVMRNLPAELVPVFRKVARGIKAGPRRTRTEAFLEWVEDNSEEAHAIIYETVERDVARLIAEQQAVETRLRTRKAYRNPEHRAAALAAVPF